MKTLREGVRSQFALAEKGGRKKKPPWPGWEPEDLCRLQPGWRCGPRNRKTFVRVSVVSVTWPSAWPGRVGGGAGAGAWGEKDAPACGVTAGPGPCPAIRLHREFLSSCFRMCMWARLCVCVFGGGTESGGEKKDTIQLNNLFGINLYLPGSFCPAGQRSSLRDG